MKKLVSAALIMASFGASADCWIVKDMKGASYASHDNYGFEKDGFSGTFMISIDGNNASVRYSGGDAGGVSYGAILPNTIVGINNNQNGQVIETWAIGKDGVVKMTKIINGFGGFDSAKAFIGSVKIKC